MNRALWIAGLLILLVAGFVASRYISIFVIEPIGAVPDGRTLIIKRMENSNFIENADSTCMRLQDGVSILCRATVLASLSRNDLVLAKLPFSKALYRLSGGKLED